MEKVPQDNQVSEYYVAMDVNKKVGLYQCGLHALIIDELFLSRCILFCRTKYLLKSTVLSHDFLLPLIPLDPGCHKIVYSKHSCQFQMFAVKMYFFTSLFVDLSKNY